MKGVKSFYVDSRECVRVGDEASECFLVTVPVGLHQGCVMSLRLFDIYMDGVVW